MIRDRPVRVSVTVFPESDPSIVFGIFDTLWAAGRGLDGMSPEALRNFTLFEPRLVSARRRPLDLVTGVSIVAQDGADDVEETDFVYRAQRRGGVGAALREPRPRPPRLHGADAPRAARMSTPPAAVPSCWPKPASSTAWRRPRIGATSTCSGRSSRDVPDAARAHSGAGGGGAAHRVVRGRLLVAGPRPLPRRPPCRHRRSDPAVEALLVPMAQRRAIALLRR